MIANITPSLLLLGVNSISSIREFDYSFISQTRTKTSAFPAYTACFLGIQEAYTRVEAYDVQTNRDALDSTRIGSLAHLQGVEYLRSFVTCQAITVAVSL